MVPATPAGLKALSPLNAVGNGEQPIVGDAFAIGRTASSS